MYEKSATLERQIRSYILANLLFSVDDGDLVNHASLLDLGIIDSTGVLELALFLEKEFHIQVKDDELLPENFDSVDSLVRFVGKRLGGA